MLDELNDVKHEIRVVHEKALAGPGKKGKGKGKAEVAPEEKKVLENCSIFVGNEFPVYKKQVLEILQTFEFVDNKCVADKKVIQQAVAAVITDKKQSGIAMKFVAFCLENAATQGKAKALQIELPFDECKILTENTHYLFENMFTIKNIKVFMSTDAENVGAHAAIAEGAVPGKPGIVFF